LRVTIAARARKTSARGDAKDVAELIFGVPVLLPVGDAVVEPEVLVARKRSICVMGLEREVLTCLRSRCHSRISAGGRARH